MANPLPFDRQVQIVALLTEGNSIRACERLTGSHRDTIMRLGVRAGEACDLLHDRLMRGLHVSILELDELWSFIAKKARSCTKADPAEWGDAYTFVALDVTRKAIISYLCGKRNTANTGAFVTDVRSRIVNRPQITSDGWKPYVEAVEAAFGADVDYAMLVKEYASETGKSAERRYSPGRVISVETRLVSGSPDPAFISTSFVERQNLTFRTQQRRFTRLTNGFSKKLHNHRAAVALHVGHYNLCRVHETLRVTPAMELGVTDHVWSIGELLERAFQAPEPEAAPILPTPRGLGLRVVKGGLS